MPIKVTCPKCQGVLHAPDDAGGKRGKCPTCGTVLAIPAVAAAEPFAAEPPRPTPTRLPEPTGPSAIDADARRASFGSLSDPPATQKTASRGSFAGDARPADPFVKPAPKTAAGPATDSEARGYRACRRGMTAVGFAVTLFTLAVTAYVVVPLLPQFGVKVPDQTPGFLKQPGLSSLTEIAVGVPLVLTLLAGVFLVLGRSSVSSAPRGSGARGTLKWASLFTFLAVAGLIAYAVPTALALFEGAPLDDYANVAEHGTLSKFLPNDEPSGQAQRAGVALLGVLGPIAEFLFWIGLGRLGSGLGDARFTGRVTRYFFYAALGYAVAGLTAYAVYYYGPQIESFVGREIQPKIDRLGLPRPQRVAAVVLVIAASVWLVYTRALRAGKRAIRLWLERHG